VRIEGRGRDLVLLHGWGFHSGAWDGVAGELASRYRLHRIDLPGHGRSQACEAPGFEQAAGLNRACLRGRVDTEVSHDHYFHSVLGLLGVHTSVYEEGLDAYAPCRGRTG